jgi:PAS domain S-box-containing protein
MLSSANKSVPTIKQFKQPYFIEIAPDGAITAICARFTRLLFEQNSYTLLERHIAGVFSQLGRTTPGLSVDSFKDSLPGIIDLSVNRPHAKSFIIRWTPSPIYNPDESLAGWQLTGVKIYSGEYRHLPIDPLQYPGDLAGYVSDILICTDLYYKITHWNKAAGNFYGIPARQAVGRQFQECVPLEYLHTTREEVFRSFHERGNWEGEVVYISPTGKKSYLLCSFHYARDHKNQITGIVIVNKDISERRQAQQDRIRAEAKLRQYSVQITNILESITDGFFVLDKNFRVTLWNHEAERTTRLSSAEMVGQVIWEKLPELVDTETYLSFRKAFLQKMSVTFEQYIERFDRWLEMSVYPSDQGLFAYFKDVSLRKEQEMLLALEKKVLELNSGKKASLQAILDYFLNGIEKIFPGMCCSVLALDDDQIHLRHLSAPGLPPAYTLAVDGMAIGPVAGSCGTALYRKEKVIVGNIATDPLWADFKDLALSYGLKACWSIPLVNAKEEVLAAFAAYYKVPKTPDQIELTIIERAANLVTLVIESKTAEEELNISNERYMLATKATNDAIWDRDMRTEMYFWGEGFYHQFGYKPGPKVRTRSFWEKHVHPEDRSRVLKNMEKFIVRKDKELWKEEYRFKKSDGKYALISDRGSLIFGKEGKVIRMVGSMQDITEKRQMEKRLLNQELNKQKLIAQAMVDAQEKERAEIGKELHDNINQILTTTKLYLELAKNDDKERLSLIGRSAMNIHEAIREIRNISRSLVPASIGDLGLVDSIADLVESLKTTRAIHVEFYPMGEFDQKVSDKEKLMLFRIIQEQVNNVLKHSSARNLIIELILEESENRIELNITDDGKGFNPEKIKNKIGLGLSNIMSRADLFGGKVTIISAPGQGCKLRVQVPVI